MSARLFVGTRKGLFMLEEDADWHITRTAFLGEPVTMLLPADDGETLFAALNLGHFGVKLHRSRDGGRDWNEIATPRYPPQPDDTQGPDWSLAQIWSLETGGAGRPRSLWAGTIPGGLFRSDDDGDTWALVESLWHRPERAEWFGGGYDAPGIHSICVDPRDNRRVTVAVSCGGVWQTRDLGESWSLCASGMRAAYMPPGRADDPGIQDPHRMVHCPAAPDTLWVQHHNGIFRSTDGAESWQEVTGAEPSSFGFAVATHPRDPDRAWFVPAVKDECRIPVNAALAVARTRDGGRSFEILRDGLPQRDAYDLVYRHGMDIHPEEAVLAFGSTTGNLWLSEDQGVHWRQLAAHLPPIYCVRFG